MYSTSELQKLLLAFLCTV